MLNFLRENSYNMIKMMIYQFGMTVFGLMLSFATATNDTLLLVTGIASIVFYMFLLYTMTWDLGARDKIRVDGGRAKYLPLKGLYISLGANSLNFILALLIIIGYFSVGEWTEELDAVSGQTVMNGEPAWAVGMYGVSKLIAMLFSGMYTAVIRLYMADTPFAFLIIILPALVVCTLGYLLGAHDFKILRSLGIKTPSSDKK